MSERTLTISEYHLPPPEVDDGHAGGGRIGDCSLLQIVEAERLVQLVALSEHTKSNAEHWSLAQTGTDLMLPHTGSLVDSLQVSLTRCLPSVSAKTEMHEILEFKSRRRAELLRFRQTFDDLCAGIANAPDKSHALIKAQEQLELSLLDLHRTLDESRFQKIVCTLRTYINLKDSSALNVVLPALGALGFGAAGAPKELGAFAGLGLNAALSVLGKRVTKLDSLPTSVRDYAYLYEVDHLAGRTEAERCE